MPISTKTIQQWIMNSAEVKTSGTLLLSGNNAPRFTPLIVSGQGFAIATAAQLATATRITAYATDATAGDTECSAYTGGEFNSELVNWPAGTTDAQKATALGGSGITLTSPTHDELT